MVSQKNSEKLLLQLNKNKKLKLVILDCLKYFW